MTKKTKVSVEAFAVSVGVFYTDDDKNSYSGCYTAGIRKTKRAAEALRKRELREQVEAEYEGSGIERKELNGIIKAAQKEGSFESGCKRVVTDVRKQTFAFTI